MPTDDEPPYKHVARLLVPYGKNKWKARTTSHNIRTELRVRRREYGMEWMDGWDDPQIIFIRIVEYLKKSHTNPELKSVDNSTSPTAVGDLASRLSEGKCFFSEFNSIFLIVFLSPSVSLVKVKIKPKEILRKYWVSLNFFRVYHFLSTNIMFRKCLTTLVQNTVSVGTLTPKAREFLKRSVHNGAVGRPPKILITGGLWT